MNVRMIWCCALLAMLMFFAPAFAAGQDKKGDGVSESAVQEKTDAADESDSTKQESDEDKANDEEPTARDLMEKAMTIAQDGNMDGAIELIEQALKLEPEDAGINMMLIGVLQTRAMELVNDDKRKEANPYFFKSASFVRGLKGDLAEVIGPRAGQVFYNEACSYAVDGDSQKALASLADAFEHGFDDIDLTRNDADFESIRENKDFVALVEKHEKLIVEKLIVETKDELKKFETYDFNFKLKNLDGEEVKLEDFKGKLVIVDFWGTWCPPCIAEIPHFIKLKDSYGDKGLEIVGLSYENAESEEEAVKGVKEFATENQMNYPCLIGDDETQELVPDFQGYPTTLFIDREGVVRLQLVGSQPHAKLESIVKELLDSKHE